MHALPWPKHGYPISERCSTTSASNATDGNSRRSGWPPVRSRISGRNPRQRNLTRGGECPEPPPGIFCFYGLWVCSAGALCFSLFDNRPIAEVLRALVGRSSSCKFFAKIRAVLSEQLTPSLIITLSHGR